MAAALGPLGAVQNTTDRGSFYNQPYLASPTEAVLEQE